MIGVDIIMLFCQKSIGSDGKCLNQNLRNLRIYRIVQLLSDNNEFKLKGQSNVNAIKLRADTQVCPYKTPHI